MPPLKRAALSCESSEPDINYTTPEGLRAAFHCRRSMLFASKAVSVVDLRGMDSMGNCLLTGLFRGCMFLLESFFQQVYQIMTS